MCVCVLCMWVCLCVCVCVCDSHTHMHTPEKVRALLRLSPVEHACVCVCVCDSRARTHTREGTGLAAAINDRAGGRVTHGQAPAAKARNRSQGPRGSGMPVLVGLFCLYTRSLLTLLHTSGSRGRARARARGGRGCAQGGGAGREGGRRGS